VDARLSGQVGYRAPRRDAWAAAASRYPAGSDSVSWCSPWLDGHGHRGHRVVLHPGDSAGQLSGGTAVMIMLIWVVIAVINVAYARHR